MGKETQLLEAAAAGNCSKVEQLLKGKSRLKRLLSKERLVDPTSEGENGSPPSLLITDKQQSTNIDVEYREQSGATALILAALNGHKDVVHKLLQYSADVVARDLQGNTALHFAAWHNRSDIVDLLLANGAKPDMTNKAGNTPLHYACQYCPAGKPFTIIKLLQSGTGVLLLNTAGDTPFDLAVRFNRKDAVSMLVDADANTLRQTKSIIEAAKNGRKEIVEILLDSGMDPNCFDGTSGSCPLHEAVRYFRKDVTRILLEFGGDPYQLSANSESPLDIANQHPEAKKGEFLSLFLEYRGKDSRIPRAIIEQRKSVDEHDKEDMFITYPLLRNNPVWTRAEAVYCSAWTQKHPNTCLLDNDQQSYWKIPAAGAYNWVAFDLGAEFTITGIRIAGWDDKQMVHTFIVETGKSMSGPWKQVQKYKADCIGPEDMEEPAESQDFRGFYASSQYWRVMIADNYGAPTTCLSEISFFGVENGVVEWFEQLGLTQYLKSFVLRGFNQMSDLALLNKMDLEGFVSERTHIQEMLEAAWALREKYLPPKNLSWAIPPESKVTGGKMMKEISVFSAPYTTGQLEIVALGGAVIRGLTVQSLVSKDSGYLSKAAFRGLSISPEGRYFIEVRSVADPQVCLRSDHPIQVIPPPMKTSEVGKVFDDLDKLLQFD